LVLVSILHLHLVVTEFWQSRSASFPSLIPSNLKILILVKINCNMTVSFTEENLHQSEDHIIFPIVMNVLILNNKVNLHLNPRQRQVKQCFMEDKSHVIFFKSSYAFVV